MHTAFYHRPSETRTARASATRDNQKTMKEHTYQGHTIIEYNELFYVFPYNAAVYDDTTIFHKGITRCWYLFRANSLTGAKTRIRGLDTMQ